MTIDDMDDDYEIPEDIFDGFDEFMDDYDDWYNHEADKTFGYD